MGEPSTNLDIAQNATLKPMFEVAHDLGIGDHLLEPFGDSVAKIKLAALPELADRPPGKYVLVTAITPTPLGEGKTTMAVGLGQALARLGRRSVVTIREPSMGPTFGIKGGGAGGGYSQVIPMEALNLHLTGDLHAVAAANNLLAAMIDNHLFHTGRGRGHQSLQLNPDTITWRRVLDVNDRALRSITIGQGTPADGVVRQTGFDITAASEVMAVLALATSVADLRERLSRIVIGASFDGTPVTAEDLSAAGSMAVLLKDAIKPNLLQTIEHTPVLVHAGPFGNIAHGNSSVLADEVGLHAADVVVTEAGFGADMGAERFFNIKCRVSGRIPDAAVVVCTVRALKVHSGRFSVRAGQPLPTEMLDNDPMAVTAGAANLRKQIENVRVHGVRPIVAINAFPYDHPAEYDAIRTVAAELGVRAEVCTHFADGGSGALGLAEAVLEEASADRDFTMLYPDEASLKEKIESVATRIYGADVVSYSTRASDALDWCEQHGFGRLPVCIAKTHLSISSDPTLVGAPTGWTLPVRDVRLCAGAGYVYALTGEIRTMPGLPAHPAAADIDLGEDGDARGLF